MKGTLVPFYIVKSNNDYFQWSQVKKVYNEFAEYKNYPSLVGKTSKEFKKYLEDKLGKFANTKRNNENVHGFVGWKLK